MEILNKNSWFEEKIEPHESSLRAWLRSRFGVEDLIDDIVQESYIRILKRSRSGRIDSPKAYLFGTARNVAIDHIKDLRKREAEPLSELTDNIVHIEVWDSARDILEHRNEVELLKAAINALPERCREIFVMRKVHGISRSEISEKLGLSTNTVSAQLRIGLRKCASFMKEANRECENQEAAR